MRQPPMFCAFGCELRCRARKAAQLWRTSLNRCARSARCTLRDLLEVPQPAENAGQREAQLFPPAHGGMEAHIGAQAVLDILPVDGAAAIAAVRHGAGERRIAAKKRELGKRDAQLNRGKDIASVTQKGSYSPEFKAKVVLDIIAGKRTLFDQNWLKNEQFLGFPG